MTEHSDTELNQTEPSQTEPSKIEYEIDYRYKSLLPRTTAG